MTMVRLVRPPTTRPRCGTSMLLAVLFLQYATSSSKALMAPALASRSGTTCPYTVSPTVHTFLHHHHHHHTARRRRRPCMLLESSNSRTSSSATNQEAVIFPKVNGDKDENHEPLSLVSSTTRNREDKDESLYAFIPQQQQRPQQPPLAAVVADNESATHLGVLVSVTLWWYVYSTIAMWQHPADFLGLPEAITRGMAVYVTLSQVAVYGMLRNMAYATTLRQAQQVVLMATALCIPADSMVILFDPTGQKLTTVLAFAGVTMCFGLYLCHYLRKAAFVEEQTQQAIFSMDNPDGLYRQVDDPHDNFFKTLETYRPPKDIQSTHMALEFARSFVAFTVALAAVRDSLGGTAVEPWLLASLVSVILHTSLEMAITTVFPGADVEEYPGFVAAESLLYLTHMVASSYIAHQSTFGYTVWDGLTNSWLFGNATAKFMGRMKLLLGKIDFDSNLGISKF